MGEEKDDLSKIPPVNTSTKLDTQPMELKEAFHLVLRDVNKLSYLNMRFSDELSEDV